MRLHALSAGVEAQTRCFSGVVHSIFHHACNVSLDCGALLTLVSSEKGNVTQGIRVGTPPRFTFLNQLRVGQPVACRGGILRVSGSDLSIDLRTANRWHIDLKGLRVDLQRRDSAHAWRVAWLELESHWPGEGISSTIAAALQPKQHHVAPHETKTGAERVIQAIPDLIDATRHVQADKTITALRQLIGLGPGLTPSGDDFIVGYLAGLWSTVGNDSSRLTFMSSVGTWLSQAASGTNAISCTYIRSAVNGNISEPIATLAQRIARASSMVSVREATRAALQVGITSGANGVLGLLLGCLAWGVPSFSSNLRRPRSLVHQPFESTAPSRYNGLESGKSTVDLGMRLNLMHYGSIHSLLLTRYTILCSSWRPRTQR
jgi:hypothetical protein